MEAALEMQRHGYDSVVITKDGKAHATISTGGNERVDWDDVGPRLLATVEVLERVLEVAKKLEERHTKTNDSGDMIDATAMVVRKATLLELDRAIATCGSVAEVER